MISRARAAIPYRIRGKEQILAISLNSMVFELILNDRQHGKLKGEVNQIKVLS